MVVLKFGMSDSGGVDGGGVRPHAEQSWGLHVKLAEYSSNLI